MITALIVLLVATAIRRGYRRGAQREIVDFLIVLIGLPIAFRLGGPIGEALLDERIPLVSRTLGAVLVFLALALVAAALQRLVHPGPEQLDRVDRAVGASLGGMRAAIVGLIVIGILAAAPPASAVGRSAQRSTLVSAMTSPDGVPLQIFEALTGEDGTVALIEFNRSFPDGPLVTDDYRQLPAFPSEDLVRLPAEGIEIFELVNGERTTFGVAPLQWSSVLSDVAFDYAEEMYVGGFFAHDSPVSGDVGDRLRAAGIRYAIAGENLALAPNVTTVHTGLMNSPGHRANILAVDYSHIGLGVVEGPIGMIVVQVFFHA